jgi:predicted Zn-ribbon and HTH transcriptional regulator
LISTLQTQKRSDGLEEELLTLVPAQCKEGGLRFARVIKVRWRCWFH